MKTIKDHVNVWQVATGKTKDDFCDLIGMPKTTLYAKLSGASEFTLSEGHRIAKILGCTVDQLFDEPIALEAYKG